MEAGTANVRIKVSGGERALPQILGLSADGRMWREDDRLISLVDHSALPPWMHPELVLDMSMRMLRRMGPWRWVQMPAIHSYIVYELHSSFDTPGPGRIALWQMVGRLGFAVGATRAFTLAGFFPGYVAGSKTLKLRNKEEALSIGNVLWRQPDALPLHLPKSEPEIRPDWESPGESRPQTILDQARRKPSAQGNPRALKLRQWVGPADEIVLKPSGPWELKP